MGIYLLKKSGEAGVSARFRLYLLTIGILVGLLPGLGGSPTVRAGTDRLVLAFYYAWFDNNTWNSGKLSDLPLNTYNSDNHEVIARQIDQARAAGIDAFVLNWWGKGNRTEKNLKAMLDLAAPRDFRVTVDFDINSPVMGGVASYADNLRHLLTVHAAHPAYLRYQGRPVVFFYNVSRLPVATWRSIRDQADPGRKALWIAEGVDLAYLSVFDGHHLYSTTWPNRIPPSQTLSSWSSKLQEYNTQNGATKLWVATVMPGYDDRKARPGSGFARSRDGGEYYRQNWQAAMDSNPQWVVINSFNEWPEGSYIEPSRTYGNQYLDLTREWAARFKGSPAPATTISQAPPAPSPTPVPPTPVPPTPVPPTRSIVIEDPRVPGKGKIGPRCGYVFTDNEWISLWEVYCYSDKVYTAKMLIID